MCKYWKAAIYSFFVLFIITALGDPRLVGNMMQGFSEKGNFDKFANVFLAILVASAISAYIMSWILERLVPLTQADALKFGAMFGVAYASVELIQLLFLGETFSNYSVPYQRAAVAVIGFSLSALTFQMNAKPEAKAEKRKRKA